MIGGRIANLALPARTRVAYKDRATGKMVDEPVFGEKALRWIYEEPLGAAIFGLFANNVAFCTLYGLWQSRRSTVNAIPAFVSKYGVLADEAEKPLFAYRNFNEFFSRRLRPDARPFAPPPALCSPVDGKVVVVPRLAQGLGLPVKGAVLSIQALLGSDKAAEPFSDGAAALFRLAPYDYHRFHFPSEGEAAPAKLIKGKYDSVSSIALARHPDVYCRNKRASTVVTSQSLGRMAIVEVGALAVASISQTYRPGTVLRGQEKGLFQFGGSTVVLIFEKGAVVFDDDLLQDAQSGLETSVRAGERIGIAAGGTVPERGHS